jgi:hypothetical protein
MYSILGREVETGWHLLEIDREGFLLSRKEISEISLSDLSTDLKDLTQVFKKMVAMKMAPWWCRELRLCRHSAYKPHPIVEVYNSAKLEE